MSGARMQERRSAPRIDHRIPLAVKERTQSFVVQTKNLSASGAYCAFSHFVAPMTKLQERLQLEVEGQARSIECQGVVVRVKPPAFRRRISAYDVAIFFSDLSDEDRATVARYVLRHLQLAASRA